MVHYLLASDLEKKKKMLEDLQSEMKSASNKRNQILNELDNLKKSRRILDDQISDLSSQIEELDLVVKRDDFRIKEMIRIVSDTKVIAAISVDEENYGLWNGLIDLKRDILMKLVKITIDDTKIRNILGMGKILYGWSKLPIFSWARSFSNFRWSTLYKSSAIEVSKDRKTAKVIGEVGLHVILLDGTKILHGVATVSVKLMNTPIYGRYVLGVLLKLPDTYEQGFGMLCVKSSMLPGYGFEEGIGGICDEKGNIVARSPVAYCNGCTVTMRVDADKGDLEYSVNGGKGPALKGNQRVKEGVYLAAQLHRTGAEWTIVSL